MTPERSKTVGTDKIEEYYWTGRMVVYVNNRLSGMSYEDAVRAAEKRHALATT